MSSIKNPSKHAKGDLIEMDTVFCNENEYQTRAEVDFAHPEAAVIKRVLGGWVVFKTYAAYEVWKSQK